MILHLIPYPLYVTERCIVTPTDRFYVRAQVEGLIVETLVREGDWVEAGEPIARLDDRDISYAEKQAKAEVDRLAANLEKVKNGNRIEEIQRVQAQVATWKQEVSFAQIENNRQRSLSAQGVASQADKDEARRDLAVKRSALAEARAELVLVEAGSRIEEFAVAKAALRGAQAKLEFYSKQKEFLTLTSPVAGHMLTPRFHERLHERVSAGDLVAEIGDSDRVLVEIFVPEEHADVLKVGLPVMMKVKAYPLESFAGKVSFVAPAIEESKDGTRTIRVEARVDNRSGLLRARLSGYAEISAGDRSVLGRLLRPIVRWARVRYLI